MENHQQSFWQFSDQLRLQMNNLANLSVNNSIWSNSYGSKWIEERQNLDIRVGGELDLINSPNTLKANGSDFNGFNYTLKYPSASPSTQASPSARDYDKGTILSTFYYGYACSQVPGGWAAQKMGGRRVLLLSFVLWSATCALVPLDPNKVKTLVLACLLVGVAQGFIFPSIHTVLAQWVPPHERSRSVSLMISGMYLGAVAGTLWLASLVKFRGPQPIFLAKAALGAIWSILWVKYASDPPRSELPKATAAGFGGSLLPIKGSQKVNVENGGHSVKTSKIPWKRIILSLPVWAIVVNNFTFHYALYVLMNWLPTYFEQSLQLSLQEMDSSKMIPYLNMFMFSNIGGGGCKSLDHQENLICN